MNSSKKKLTSVRIDPELFNKFKEACIKDNFTFQKLAERSIFYYLTDSTFKEKVQKRNKLQL